MAQANEFRIYPRSKNGSPEINQRSFVCAGTLEQMCWKMASFSIQGNIWKLEDFGQNKRNPPRLIIIGGDDGGATNYVLNYNLAPLEHGLFGSRSLFSGIAEYSGLQPFFAELGEANCAFVFLARYNAIYKITIEVVFRSFPPLFMYGKLLLVRCW